MKMWSHFLKLFSMSAIIIVPPKIENKPFSYGKIGSTAKYIEIFLLFDYSWNGKV